MVETIMRTQSAITTLPFINKDNEELLTEWLNQMLFPMNPTLDAPAVDLSTTIDAGQVTCWANNDRKILAQQIAAFMKASSFNETEFKILKKAFKTFPEDQLRAWLQLNDQAQETGWAFTGTLPLEEAFSFIPKGDTKDNLEKWYAQFEANACVRVGRSIAGNRYSILHTELFGNNIEEDMQLYLDLMSNLNLSPLPEVLLGMIMDQNPEYLELVLWIGGAGTLKAGLIVPEPSEEFIRLLSVAYAEDSQEALAAFEGSIGKTPKSVEIARTAKGIELEVNY